MQGIVEVGGGYGERWEVGIALGGVSFSSLFVFFLSFFLFFFSSFSSAERGGGKGGRFELSEAREGG